MNEEKNPGHSYWAMFLGLFSINSFNKTLLIFILISLFFLGWESIRNDNTIAAKETYGGKLTVDNAETVANSVIDEESDTPPTINIIVIGWDGINRNHLFDCYNSELAECPDGLPNIKELSGDNIFNSVATSATMTKPGWVEILSGYDAESLGVKNNREYKAIPEGYTILEKLENYFGDENITTLFLSGKKIHIGGGCVGENARCEEIYFLEKDEPWCEVKKNFDFFESCKVADEVIFIKSLKLLDKHKDEKMFAFFHFGQPDRISHKNSESSTVYTEQIKLVDYYLGAIVDKLKQLGIYNETLIYVTTDHGFDEGLKSHGNAPYTFLATNDPLVVRGGDRKDLAPTILERYGVNDKLTGVRPIEGYSLYSAYPFSCVAEGEAYIDSNGTSQCCDGLSLIKMEKVNKWAGGCLSPTGGENDTSGYCTNCGDGKCNIPENKCNCPSDCK